MKKYFAILLSIFIVLISVRFAFAQSPSPVPIEYATAYQSYIDKTGIYQNAYNNYLTARSAYEASQSLDAKDKAMTATLKMLQARDDVMAAYLTAIKVKIKITGGISDGDKSSLSSQLDTDVSWYNAHNTRLTSAGSLDDLVSDSNEAKDHYTQISQLLVYTSVIALGAGNNSYIRSELTNEISALTAKIDEIKANQDKDVSSIERSLVDIQNKLSRSEAKDNDAKNLITTIKATNTQKDSIFQEAEQNLLDSNSYLKEANDGLLQIITQIKTN